MVNFIICRAESQIHVFPVTVRNLATILERPTEVTEMGLTDARSFHQISNNHHFHLI
jgi:hypothetical protein